MEKRLLLAVTLSVLVIVGFSFISRPHPPVALRQPSAEKSAIDAPQDVRALTAEVSVPTETTVAEETAAVETDKHEIVFSNVSGAIKEIRLKDFKSGEGDAYLLLAQVPYPHDHIFALDDYSNQMGIRGSVYKLDKQKDSLTSTLETNDTIITKKYDFNTKKYTIDLSVSITNNSDIQKSLTYRILGGSGIIEREPQDKRFVEVVSKIDDKITKYRRPNGKRIIDKGAVSWTALKNKHFSLILKPFADTDLGFYEEKRGILLTGVEVKNFMLMPHSSIEHKYTLYAGPSDIDTLKSVGPDLDESVNLGMFGGISKLLLWIMKVTHSMIGNWGLTIIALSIFLNVILFPLTQTSFKSMQKMQSLQPQIEKLKAQNKSNPQKLNKEIMELYKKNKVNPFSGCLPLLLQMPIFLALYNSLTRSIALKNASFLWIKDLSLQEAIKIPFSIPIIGNKLNILPFFMAGAMVVQQKMSSAMMGGGISDEQRQQQKMMTFLMPVMFGVMFYQMPSGLVLYWLVNTVLTIIEQAAISRKHS